MIEQDRKASAQGDAADGLEYTAEPIRAELAREVMDAEVRPVSAQLLGRDGEFDGLQERVCGRAGL